MNIHLCLKIQFSRHDIQNAQNLLLDASTITPKTATKSLLLWKFGVFMLLTSRGRSACYSVCIYSGEIWYLHQEVGVSVVVRVAIAGRYGTCIKR